MNPKKAISIPVRADNTESHTPSSFARAGFTVLEIIVLAAIVGLCVLFFFLQKDNVEAMHRDEQRKTAINAMYYALEEDFYQDNGYYPQAISEENITAIDPSLWTDPSGYQIGDPAGSYFYEPANCDDGKCQQYTLKAILEKEDIYEKNNQN